MSSSWTTSLPVADVFDSLTHDRPCGGTLELLDGMARASLADGMDLDGLGIPELPS
jgi:hypothetical protein